MAKPITRQMHGPLTDYPYFLAVTTAPFWLGFRDDHTPALLCYALGGLILFSSLLTRAEWGLVKVVPFKMHLTLDVLAGIFAVASPFIFGFADHAVPRNALFVFGIVGILAGTMSQANEMARGSGPLES